MSLTTVKDFIDVVSSVLESGTWTNYGKTPKIVQMHKGDPTSGTIRGNKNARIVIWNLPSPKPEQAFDGSLILQYLNGVIGCIHTDNSKRNVMKADLMNILKDNFSHEILTIEDNPKIRNKETSLFSVQIINC